MKHHAIVHIEHAALFCAIVLSWLSGRLWESAVVRRGRIMETGDRKYE